MAAFMLRSLLTACCIVLLMPPGWCRMMCAAVVVGAEDNRKKLNGGCCALCQCPKREKPPTGPTQPVPPERCCCYELDWLKPNPPDEPAVDLSLMAFVTPEDSASTWPALRHDLGFSIRGPTPPLHLLKCVWLC